MDHLVGSVLVSPVLLAAADPLPVALLVLLVAAPLLLLAVGHRLGPLGLLAFAGPCVGARVLASYAWLAWSGPLSAVGHGPIYRPQKGHHEKRWRVSH